MQVFTVILFIHSLIHSFTRSSIPSFLGVRSQVFRGIPLLCH